MGGGAGKVERAKMLVHLIFMYTRRPNELLTGDFVALYNHRNLYLSQKYG